jgi:hypothetical protein
MIEYLPYKCKALSSNPVPSKTTFSTPPFYKKGPSVSRIKKRGFVPVNQQNLDKFCIQSI